MSQLPPDGIYSAKPVYPYEPKPAPPSEQRTSGMAVASFILSFFTPLLCVFSAIPSVILGFMSLNKIGNSQGRLKGSGFAISGIVISGVCLLTVVPALLLLPAINAAREAARRNGCLNNMRSVALGTQSVESSQKRFPLASDATTDLLRGQTAGGHGDAPAATDDGFSFLHKLLPYLEETILYKEMKKVENEDESQTGPFDADLRRGPMHFAATQVGVYRCPSYSGEMTTSLGDVHDAAVGNYCAIVATDVAEPPAAMWKRADIYNWENGAIVSACWTTPSSQSAALEHGVCKERGTRLKNIGDGISKTIFACESREKQFSAWISGVCMSVVAATPNSLAAGGAQVATTDNNFIGLTGTEGLALNFGDDYASGDPSSQYLGSGDWATGQDRSWGPSSEHAQNVVIHVFLDAHARAISAEVDPTVYLRFITRNDGDPAKDDDLDPR